MKIKASMILTDSVVVPGEGLLEKMYYLFRCNMLFHRRKINSRRLQLAFGKCPRVLLTL